MRAQYLNGFPILFMNIPGPYSCAMINLRHTTSIKRPIALVYGLEYLEDFSVLRGEMRRLRFNHYERIGGTSGVFWVVCGATPIAIYALSSQWKRRAPNFYITVSRAPVTFSTNPGSPLLAYTWVKSTVAIRMVILAVVLFTRPK